MGAATLTTVLTTLTLLLALTSLSCGLNVIDLTYQLKEGEVIGWYVYNHFNFTILTRGRSDLTGGWVEFNEFSMPEHRGTHVDAPAHFAKDHWRMHQVPPSRLVGPGVVVDVTEKVNGNSDYAVTVEDLQDWERRFGRIPRGAVVLMRSGWGSRYPHVERVFSTTDVTNSSTFHFPGFSAEAATFLAEQRDITAVGGDTPSPDVAISHEFPVHFTMLERDILILENVANVDRLPETGSTIVLGALRIFDGSGAPLRLLALTDINDCNCQATNGAGRPGGVCLLSGMLLLLLMMRMMKMM